MNGEIFCFASMAAGFAICCDPVIVPGGKPMIEFAGTIVFPGVTATSPLMVVGPEFKITEETITI